MINGRVCDGRSEVPIRHEQSDPRKELRSIQYLRGLAAFLIVVLHEVDAADRYAANYFSDQQIRGFTSLNSGVDIFFVVSGFIMTYVIFGSDRPFSRRQFIVRRIVRIVPMYWLFSFTALAGLLFVVQNPLHAPARTDGIHILASLFFVPDGSAPPIYTGWTLSYEMLFYTVICMLHGPSMRETILRVGGLFTLFIVAGALLPWDEVVWQMITNPLLLEFVGGCCIGMLFLDGRLTGTRLGFSLVAAALVYFAATYALSVDASTEGPARIWLWGVPASLLVAGFVSLNGSVHWFKNVFILALGNASYTLYLSHALSLTLAHRLLARMTFLPPLASLIAGVIFAVLVAVVIYYLVERPMTDWLNRLVSTSAKLSVGPKPRLRRTLP